MIRKGLLLSVLPLAVIFAAGLWGWIEAEPGGRFPVHWGLDGQPDRYGGRTETFLGLPLLALGLTTLLAVLPALDPRGSNLRRSAAAYLTGWQGGLWLLALIQLALLMVATGAWSAGPEGPMQKVVTIGVGLLLAAIGNVLGKARPNWFVGVRTPWTLSSDVTWDRTHRLAGRLFVVVGLAGVIAALALPEGGGFAVLVGGALVAAVVSAVYSYLIWRRAPDRRPGPQTID